MRKKEILFAGLFSITLLIGIMIAADKTIIGDEISDIATRQAQVAALIEEIPVKNTELKEKVYSGTMAQIVNQRTVDVNEVFAFAQDTREQAVALVIELGVNLDSEDVKVFNVILDRQADIKKLEQQKCNTEFLQAVIEVLDPNQLDPNDPNYLETIQRDAEIMQIVLEISQPL